MHLLDAETGEYNRRQVAAAFPHQRAFLVTLAHREEGLLQHKLGKRGLPGYETALSTHLEVATAVAEERADVGLGAAGAARGLGLEFVHLTWERYDLLTTDEAFYRKPTQAFFEMVKSEWLRKLIAKLPGYDARERGSSPSFNRSSRSRVRISAPNREQDPISGALLRRRALIVHH